MIPIISQWPVVVSMPRLRSASRPYTDGASPPRAADQGQDVAEAERLQSRHLEPAHRLRHMSNVSNPSTSSGRGTSGPAFGLPGKSHPVSAISTSAPNPATARVVLMASARLRRAPASSPASPHPAAPTAAPAAAVRSVPASPPCIRPPARRSPATPRTTTSRCAAARNGFTMPSMLCSSPVQMTGAMMPPSRIGRFGHMGSIAPYSSPTRSVTAP